MSWEDYGLWGATIKMYLSEWMCEGNKELREDISCREETERKRKADNKQGICLWRGTFWGQHNEKMQYSSRPSQLLMHRQCCEKDKARHCWTQIGVWQTLAGFFFFPEHHSYQAACVQLQHLGCDFLAAAQNLLLNPTCQSHVCSQRPLPVSKCFKITLPGTAHIILQSYLRQKPSCKVSF